MVCQVHAAVFSPDGSIVVTAGLRHIKIWVVAELPKDNKAVVFEGRSVTLGDYKDAIFHDVCFVDRAQPAADAEGAKGKAPAEAPRKYHLVACTHTGQIALVDYVAKSIGKPLNLDVRVPLLQVGFRLQELLIPFPFLVFPLGDLRVQSVRARRPRDRGLQPRHHPRV